MLGSFRRALRVTGRQSDSLGELIRPLWPQAVIGHRADRGATSGHALHFVALPDTNRPTLLVPRRPRRAAAAVLVAHRGGSSPRRRLERLACRALALGGAAELIPGRLDVWYGDDRVEALDAYLASLLGEPVAVGIHLGPPRANRKPVVQLVSSSGSTLGFAKVGVNDLSRRLVRDEADALRRLHSEAMHHLVIPDVLSSSSWAGLEMLVLSPVDTTSTARPRWELLRRAMLEVNDVGGRHEQALTTSKFWLDLRSRLDGLGNPQAAALAAAMARLASSTSPRIPFGSWHGDWTPWNMAWQHDRVVVWDWERFGSGVPCGMDVLHFDMQKAIRSGRGASPRAALQTTARRARMLLAPFGIDEDSAWWVVVAYLAAIGTRYLEDGQAEAGARLGDLRAWLLAELPELVDDLVGRLPT